MSIAKSHDGFSLFYQDVGTGVPIVFVHEFGGDHRSWEPQVNHFSRHHRCLTFAARGYPPSDVPESFAVYSQENAVRDIAAVMDACGIDAANIVGLSMGGFAALHFGLMFPTRALSLTVAGAGYGAEKQFEDYFRQVSLDVAKNFEEKGSKEFAKIYSLAASRVQFQNKDPLGWGKFAHQLSEHSARGSANTMRGVQARRPSLYDLEDDLKSMRVPTLVIVGDEDDHCLQPGVFLKRTLPACGLLVLPKTGHTINLEEPATFNRFVEDFIWASEAGKWTARDPRATLSEIMKTR